MKLSQRLTIAYIRTKFKILAFLSKRMAAKQAFTLFCTPFSKSASPTPAIFELAENLSFMLENKKINGFRWNNPQQQKILLLHGFSSCAYRFQHFVQPLINQGFEVLAFDAPAHGSSQGNTVNALEYCQMIKKVIALYGPIQHFIAHSFGGLAVSLALEEITTPNKLVLIAPATETTSAINNAFKLLGIKNKQVRKAFDQLIFKLSGKGPDWFSIRRAIIKINATILWVHDEEDDITPYKDVLPIKNEEHSNIRFITTKGLGHRKIYTNRQVKEKIIHFFSASNSHTEVEKKS